MSFARKLTTRDAGLLLLLVIAAVLLAIGLVTPLMTIKTLVFLRNSFSVVSGVYDLWVEERYFLFAVIILFSIVLPIVKIGLLGRYIIGRLQRRALGTKLLRLIHDYGRWAMLDVLVVAVLIVTVKFGAVASVEIHLGLYIFGAAVLLIMFITDQVARLYDRDSATGR